MKITFKQLVALSLFFILAIGAKTTKAQIQDPATWAYGLKKIGSNIYEIHLRCTLEKDWHIYAQKQGKDFIGTRTKIEFDKQAGLGLIGTPEEKGKKDKYENKEIGIINYEYAGTVDFVQKATIKDGVLKITGKVTYQTCTHERCLSEKTISFSIPVSK